MSAISKATQMTPDERRMAPRFSLMMRAAKLLSQDGEFVCVVRDVSHTGLRLRLFHEPPPGDFFLVELSNGEHYAVEKVWAADGHAGFRFAAPIDVEHFVIEPSDLPRRALRLRIGAGAQVHYDNGDAPAQLVNLSQHGACIELGSPLAERQMIRLDVRGIPSRVGHVRWRKGFTHGLVFQQAFRLDELARHAFALQLPDRSAESGSAMLYA